MPKTGFVPGQYIEATLNLSNTSNINVEKISAKLQRVSMQTSESTASNRYTNANPFAKNSRLCFNNA